MKTKTKLQKQAPKSLKPTFNQYIKDNTIYKFSTPHQDFELSDEQMKNLFEQANEAFTFYSTISNRSKAKLKQIQTFWTQQYFLALCRETLGIVRGKYDNLPIPGGLLNLNWQHLYDKGLEEQHSLQTLLIGKI